MSTTKSIIDIQDLKKSYKDLKVLDGINLKVERGKMLALLGPNGAGKTTIVKILSTLLLPDSGIATVHNYDVVKEAKKVRESIGLTGQYAAVDELLTGRENLVMIGRLYRLSKEQSKNRAKELLEQFDLVDSADRLAKSYSGGMRRRLDLAASLVAVPPVIFLDEPTTGLDPRSRLAMWKIIADLMKKHDVTILLTTQYLEEADKLADRIAVLDHGRIIAEGTGDELKNQIGAEQINLVVAQESNFDQAVRIVKQVSDKNGTTLQQFPDERRMSLATDGSVRAIKSVLDPLYEAKIELDKMTVDKPTLDDVFLQLTNK